MMRLASFAVMLPAWTAPGGLSTFDTGLPLWWGLAVGAGVGVILGVVFGGIGYGEERAETETQEMGAQDRDNKGNPY
jgi:hypothetical protein